MTPIRFNIPRAARLPVLGLGLGLALAGCAPTPGAPEPAPSIQVQVGTPLLMQELVDAGETEGSNLDRQADRRSIYYYRGGIYTSVSAAGTSYGEYVVTSGQLGTNACEVLYLPFVAGSGETDRHYQSIRFSQDAFRMIDRAEGRSTADRHEGSVTQSINRIRDPRVISRQLAGYYPFGTTTNAVHR